MKHVVIAGLIAILCSCSHNEEQLPTAVVLKDPDHTVDGNELRDKIRSNDVKLIFTDREGNKRLETRDFHPGDELYVKVDDMKEHISLEDYSLGITPLSDNVTIKRLDKTRFQINVAQKTDDPTFQLEVYVYSKEVLFSNAFHDTIDGYDNDKTGHSISLLGYAFPIVK